MAVGFVSTGIQFPDSSIQVTAAAGATGVPVLTAYTSSGTWTKPATVKAIKVTVVGGGGSGGNCVTNLAPPAQFDQPSNLATGGGGGGGSSIKIYPGPSLPGPQPYTVGGAGATSSFGVAPITVITATGGSSTPQLTGPGGNPNPGNSLTLSSSGAAGGSGSSGDLNFTGGGGGAGLPGGPAGGTGGSSILGGGGSSSVNGVAGGAGGLRGGGGAGSARSAPGLSPGTVSGGAGAAGVVIVEEFY